MAESSLRKLVSTVGRKVSKHGVRSITAATDHGSSAALSEDFLKDGAIDKTQTTLKSLHDLPGPRGYPIVGTAPEYFRKENRGQMQHVQRKFHEKYGKIFKEKLGPVTNVSIADPNLLEELFRKEEKIPFRPPYESWILYKKLRGQKMGLMSAVDEDWYKARSVLSKRLLRPKAIGEYTGVMNEITDDFVSRIRYLRDNCSPDNSVPNFPNELCKWAAESVASVLLEKRLGCLENDMPQDAQTLIDSIGRMFLTGHQLMVFANVHQRLGTKTWKTHIQSLDNIYGIAKKIIDDKVKSLESAQLGEDERTGFLSYLLANEKLDMEEIHVNITEVLSSGIDTTSSALGFAMCLLGENPRVQEKLQGEIQQVLGNKECQSTEQLQEMRYVKSVLKETMRLYPVVCINARVMKKDTVIGGHVIPKDTCVLINTYTMSHDKEYFDDPEQFIPERWDRNSNTNLHHFTTVPFGFGARSCIGRRIAEQELHLGIIKMAQNFWVEQKKGDIKPVLRTLLIQNKIPLTFVDR